MLYKILYDHVLVIVGSFILIPAPSSPRQRNDTPDNWVIYNAKLTPDNWVIYNAKYRQSSFPATMKKWKDLPDGTVIEGASDNCMFGRMTGVFYMLLQ